MIIGALLLSATGYEKYSDYKIELKARELGMIYSDNLRVDEEKRDGEQND